MASRLTVRDGLYEEIEPGNLELGLERYEQVLSADASRTLEAKAPPTPVRMALGDVASSVSRSDSTSSSVNPEATDVGVPPRRRIAAAQLARGLDVVRGLLADVGEQLPIVVLGAQPRALLVVRSADVRRGTGIPVTRAATPSMGRQMMRRGSR